MAGKPNIAADDDDLIVEVEELTKDYAPEPEEGVEEFAQPALESPTLPEGEEEGEEPERPGKQEAVEEPYDDSYERIAAAEESLRQERANSIWSRAQAEAEVNDTKINAAKVASDTLKFRLDNAYEALNGAAEAGNSAAKLQIERDIRTMEQMRQEIDAGVAQMPTKQQILNKGQADAQQVLSQQPQGKKVGSGIQARHPLAERWAGANGWMRTNSTANNFVIKQSEAMTRDGYDPNSPGFYAELSKRVRNAYPSLKVEALQATKRAPGGKNMRSPVAPSRSASGAGTVSRVNGQTRFTLTSAEQRAMQRFNLDPQNKAHQKAWAKTRMERANRERAPQ
jgi:HAMP domain-containing protein